MTPTPAEAAAVMPPLTDDQCARIAALLSSGTPTKAAS